MGQAAHSVTATLALPELSVDEYDLLRADIQARGVSVPIEVDEDGMVLDGLVRLRICQELGIRDYPRIVRSGMSDEEKAAYRLVLNLARRHLTRQQKADLSVQLHSMGWSRRRIARNLQIDQRSVGRYVESRAANAAPAPQRVVGEDGRSYPARKVASAVVTTAGEQRAATSALTRLGAQAPAKIIPINQLKRKAREAEHAQPLEMPEQLGTAQAVVYHCAITDLPIEDQSVDVILTDPPYTRDGMAAYSDLSACAGRWLKPGGTLLALTGQMFLPDAIARLSEHLEYRWILASVFDHGNSAIHSKAIINCWRPVLAFRKPGPGKPAMIPDLVRSPRSDKALHPWQQSVVEASTLLQATASAGSLVVDPFAGSGTVAVAAIENAMTFIGGDSDERAVAVTRQRLLALDR